MTESTCDESCREKGIPDHLHALARENDQEFQGDEILYRRYKLSSPDLTAAISFNRMSVNRGKYSQSWDDVLWDDDNGGRHDGYGVIEVKVADFEGSWDHPNQEEFPVGYSFIIQHKLKKCNYPHSEVVVVQSDKESGIDEEVTEIKPTSIKLKIRQYLSARARFLSPEERAGDYVPVKASNPAG